MTGIRIEVTSRGLDHIKQRLSRLSQFNRALALEQIGGLVESQTKRRISSEKRSPDGVPWKPNLEGTSILVREGHLLSSIHYVVGGDHVRIGSGLIYAAIHQLGGVITPKKAKRLAFTLRGKSVFAKKVTIPARPYLGLSAANEVEIETAMNAYLRGLLQ